VSVYLVSFTSQTGVVDRIDIQSFFNAKKEVLNWFGVMPQAILVMTNDSASMLTSWLQIKYGKNLTFLVTPATPSGTAGLINKEVWDFINTPKPSGGLVSALRGIGNK